MYVCNSLKNTDLVASWHIITIYMQYIKPLVTPFNHLFINLIQSNPPTLLSMRKMEIKTTMSYHLVHIRMAINGHREDKR